MGNRVRTGSELLEIPTAAESRRRVQGLFALAIASVALPLAIGAYALKQSTAEQRMLMETSRLAHAEALAAHVAPMLDPAIVEGAFAQGDLFEKAHRSRLGRTGSVSLVDPRGLVLASTDRAWQGRSHTSSSLLEALAAGRAAVVHHPQETHPRLEFSALAPVANSPYLLVLSQAAAEVYAPVANLERLSWLGLGALTAMSGGLFGFALQTFRRYDRKLHRECSLATGVVEGTTDMIFVRAVDGRFLLVNDPAAEFLGRPREEIVGHPIHDLMDPERAEHTDRFDREVIDSGRSTRREFHGIRQPDGKPYVVWTSRHPLLDRAGVVSGVVGVSRDVTARHELVNALRASEQRLRLITDNLPALVAYIDRDERYRFANARIGETLGVDTDTILGKTLREVRGDLLYNAHAAELAAVFRGEIVTFEGRFSVRGRQHTYRTTYVPDTDGEGHVQGFYSMTFDITDLKTAQVLLAASETKLRLIADNLPALVAYIDHDRRFQFNNARYAELLGRPVTEITGRLISEVIDSRVLAQVEPHLDRAFKGSTDEFEFVWPDTGRVMRGTYIPDFNELNEVVGVYGVLYDITVQRETEDALRQEAHLDALTGLYNRRRLESRLAESIARSERYGQPMALMFLDLDHLKSINDRFGHEGGDLALKAFSRRLTRSVRTTDTVARVAGDEFIVILEAIENEAEAGAVAAKVGAAMAMPFEVDGSACTLSASIGIALRRPGETDAESLIRRADLAMYRIKGSGRGQYLVDS